jgi:RNA polymerase sigma-70 factor (ECF subfamily)
MSAQDDVIRRWKPLAREAVDWEAVYREELPRVFNFFRYRLGDGPQAEDLTSATFEKAWRERGRYRANRAAFSTWLFTIARNLATDYFRTHRETIPLERLDRATQEIGVEEKVQMRQDFSHLIRILEELPDREGELIALKYGGDLTNREIALLMGLTESNVGTLLHRIVQRLRRRWEVENGR